MACHTTIISRKRGLAMMAQLAARAFLLTRLSLRVSYIRPRGILTIMSGDFTGIFNISKGRDYFPAA
jgi:hypothetical protein